MLILDLPEPDLDARQHSQALTDVIVREIKAAGGWIDFSQYMTLALYAPGLGYYSAGLQKFGEGGDFITAPELSPLFAQSLANPVAAVLSDMAGGNIIEFGAGSGVLAAGLLAELHLKQQLPERYFIIELSAELKQRQQQTLNQRVPELMDRVEWLDALPEQPLKAVVLANEVLDAMPVRRFVKMGNEVQALGVAISDDGLVLRPGETDTDLQQAVDHVEEDIGHQLAPAYRSELNLNIEPWLRSLADALLQGAVYLIDYGYPRSEYYLPERDMGTFMCYYRHRTHDDALWYPGLQDMTAFVDFTAVAEAALAAGFEIAGFTSQSNFLLDSGMAELLERQMPDSEKERIALVQQMKSLTLPTEMGERFKVMALDKNLPGIIPGFRLRDYSARL